MKLFNRARDKVAPDPLDAANSMPRQTAILRPHPARCSNVIITAKYTVFSFVPNVSLELLHPFKRFHNFYFFTVGLFQMIPSISITNGVPNTWMSLMFIMGCDMVLLAREDIGRHKADQQTNDQQVDVLSAEDGENAEMRRRRCTGLSRYEYMPILPLDLPDALVGPTRCTAGPTCSSATWSRSTRESRSLLTCCCCVRATRPASAG